MKKKFSEEKPLQAEEAKDMDKKTMSEKEFDMYIEKIMNNAENPKPENEKKEKKGVNKEKPSELDELKGDLRKLINSLSVISENITLAQKNVTNVSPNNSVKPNAQSDIQKAKILNAMLAEKKRADAMRKHLFAQAEDLKSTFSDFDLRTLYNTSPEFKAELDRTRSVYGAYLKYIASKLGNIPSAKPRFVENGAMPGFTSGSINASPAGLPDKEFDEYIHGILGDL